MRIERKPLYWALLGLGLFIIFSVGALFWP